MIKKLVLVISLLALLLIAWCRAEPPVQHCTTNGLLMEELPPNVYTNPYAAWLTNFIVNSTNYEPCWTTNTLAPFTFQYDHSDVLTNVVVGSSYAGTIQVGDRVFTVAQLTNGVLLMPETHHLIELRGGLFVVPETYSPVKGTR